MSESPDPAAGGPVRRETWRRRVVAAQRQRFPAHRTRSRVWLALVITVFFLAGALFVTSAVNSDGTDLRAGRYGDLKSLIREQKEEADALQARANELTDEVNGFAEQENSSAVATVQEEIDELRQPAGLQAVEGPGLTVTLEDAPDGVSDTAEVSANDLVVHQQDIQAVANAMWAGGAEAMTIQGQRVISTTGIKCVGNTVVLHGIPYSPPYVLTAVGDPDAMLQSINSNRYIEIYLEYVEVYQLGWDVETHTNVELPAYDGPLELTYAQPADSSGESDDEL